MSTGIAAVCAYCGRPIGATSTWIGGSQYHPECTRGPIYEPLTSVPGCVPFKYLTEEDVRRIVREELEKVKP